MSKNLPISSCQSDMLNSDRILQSELFSHDQTAPDIHLCPHENQSLRTSTPHLKFEITSGTKSTIR